MKISGVWSLVAFCAAMLFSSLSSAAALGIVEGPGGTVTFSGDCNFTCNDWISGSQSQPGPEQAVLNAVVYNPGGYAGTQTVYIHDLNGSVSDVFSMVTDWNGLTSNSNVTANFCSAGAAGGLVGGACDLGGTISNVNEDQFGNFGLTIALDPNMSASGISSVPEPASLALLGLGLAGLGFSRRKKA